MSVNAEIPSANHNQKKETERTEFQIIDKRHFLNLENLDKTQAVEEKPRYPSFVEELMGRVAETERRFEEKKVQIDAEIARTKSRLEADYARRVELEKQKIILPVLDVLDNLERALASFTGNNAESGLRHGVEMTVNLFRSKLQSLGVEAIAVLEKPFDPNLGMAVGVVPVSIPDQDGVVKEEVLRGYRIGELVLRPAQVLVGKIQSTT